jgi:hypothetical protein
MHWLYLHDMEGNPKTPANERNASECAEMRQGPGVRHIKPTGPEKLHGRDGAQTISLWRLDTDKAGRSGLA